MEARAVLHFGASHLGYKLECKQHANNDFDIIPNTKTLQPTHMQTKQAQTQQHQKLAQHI